MMTTEPIIESGMTFGPYSEGHCFYIEKSPTLKKINKRDGIQIAEFLLLEFKDTNKATISIVEAKTSSPQNPNEYINEIKEKLSNSLALFIAIYLQRHAKNHSELSDHFNQLQLSNVSFRLILVIKNSKKEWLPPLENKLKKALNPTVKIWNLTPTSVIVLNEEGAIRRGLVNASATDNTPI
jgi:hypothetical protein